jgi:4-amino-4-deoxy-L-arabinose transferase-like glycosyltransferase
VPTSRIHTGTVFREGNRLLETSGRYERNLAMARLGVIPFFVLGCLAIFWLTRHHFGLGAAVAAVGFASTTPMILAHGGVATTDMAFTATLLLALVSIHRYLDAPAKLAAVGVGAAAALPLVTKLSAVTFLPASVAAVVALALLSRKRGERIGLIRPSHLALIAATTVLVIWATYRFSVGTPLHADGRLLERFAGTSGPPAALHRVFTSVANWRVVPAVEWFAGVKDLLADNAEGRKAYLLGKTYLGGDPLYFPVGVLVKTPIAVLLLEVGGILLAWGVARSTGRWLVLAPVAAAGAILLMALPGNINIGVRHVLPLFLLVTPYAGLATARLWSSRGWHRAGLAALLLWCAWSTTRVHPDYLAYFNEAALFSREPLLVNSDLDWGQDAKRLVSAARELQIDSLHLEYFGSADLRRRGLERFDLLSDYTPVTGWVAISRSALALGRVFEVPSDQFAWLKAYPVARKIGESILLYRIPPR